MDILEIVKNTYIVEVKDTLQSIISTNSTQIISEQNLATQVVDTNIGTTEVVITISTNDIQTLEQPIFISQNIKSLEIVEACNIRTASEEEDMYSTRTDFTNDDTIIYKGEAVPGSLTSAPVWRIKQTTIANDGDINQLYANGVPTFTHVWDDRLTYSYTN